MKKDAADQAKYDYVIEFVDKALADLQKEEAEDDDDGPAENSQEYYEHLQRLEEYTRTIKPLQDNADGLLDEFLGGLGGISKQSEQHL